MIITKIVGQKKAAAIQQRQGKYGRSSLVRRFKLTDANTPTTTSLPLLSARDVHFLDAVRGRNLKYPGGKLSQTQTLNQKALKNHGNNLPPHRRHPLTNLSTVPGHRAPYTLLCWPRDGKTKRNRESIIPQLPPGFNKPKPKALQALCSILEHFTRRHGRREKLASAHLRL